MEGGGGDGGNGGGGGGGGGGGDCHGSALGDDKPSTPATTHATTPTAMPPIVAIGRHDLSFETHSIQDLEALADTELLRDIRTASGCTEGVRLWWSFQE